MPISEGADGPLSDVSLKARSDRILALLRQLSWVVPTAVAALFVVVVLGFYQLRAKPMAIHKADTWQREATETMAAKLESTASQVERMVLTLRDWVQSGVVVIDDLQAMNRLMIPVLAQHSMVRRIHLVDGAGRVAWLPKPADEGQAPDPDPRKQPWFAGVMAAPENGVFWTTPYLLASIQEPGITAAIRWSDKASGEQMVIAFDVLLSDLAALAWDLPYTDQGGVLLLTAEGHVLGMPRLAGSDAPQAIKKATLQAPADIGLAWLEEALAARAVSVSDPGPSGRILTGPDGQAWRVALKPMPLRNQSFRLALMAPEAAFAPWSRPFVSSLWLALLLLVAAGGHMAHKLMKQVAEPVGELFDHLGGINRQLAAKGRQATHLAAMASDLQKAPDVQALGQALLSGLARYIPLGYGSLYTADNRQRLLQAATGFAWNADLNLPAQVAYGNGLLGQCAQEQRMLRLDQPGDGYVKVQSALTASAPACLLLMPVKSSNGLLGVLELALLQPPAAEEEALLNDLLPTLALCLEIQAHSEGMRRLLGKMH